MIFILFKILDDPAATQACQTAGTSNQATLAYGADDTETQAYDDENEDETSMISTDTYCIYFVPSNWHVTPLCFTLNQLCQLLRHASQSRTSIWPFLLSSLQYPFILSLPVSTINFLLVSFCRRCLLLYS